jgi:hypothetical protein
MGLSQRPRSSSIKGSTLLINRRLWGSLAGAEDNDSLNIYMKLIQVGKKIPKEILNKTQQALNESTSIISNYKKHDPSGTSKELIVKLDELTAQLNERNDIQTALSNEFKQMDTTVKSDIKNIPPTLKKGNVVYANQLKTIEAKISSVDSKIVREILQVDALYHKADDFLKLCAKVSGIPVPRLGTEAMPTAAPGLGS